MAKRVKVASSKKSVADSTPAKANNKARAKATPQASKPKAAPPTSKPKAAPAKRKPAAIVKTTPPIVVHQAVAAEAATGTPLADRFVNFDDAKSATIDALLEIIEAAEQRLTDVKRVGTFDDLEPLANGHL